MKLLILLIMILSFSLSWASEDDHHGEEHHDDEHEGSGEKIGANKAVLEFSEAEGIRFSKAALKSFPITTEKIKYKNKNQFLVSSLSINITLDKYSVFKLESGHYKQVSVDVIKKVNDQYLIKSTELKNNDEIANSNVSILNITHVFLEDDSEYGHGH